MAWAFLDEPVTGVQVGAIVLVLVALTGVITGQAASSRAQSATTLKSFEHAEVLGDELVEFVRIETAEDGWQGTASLTSSATTTIRFRDVNSGWQAVSVSRVAEIRDNPGVGWIDDDVPGGDLVGVDGVEPVTERRLRAHDLEGEDAVGRVHRDRVSRRSSSTCLNGAP